MRSKSIKLYSTLTKNEMHCEAWEHVSTSKTQVVLFQEDPITGVMLRSVGATKIHPTWDEALQATFDAAAEAKLKGWLEKGRQSSSTRKTGRRRRRSPWATPPPPNPNPPVTPGYGASPGPSAPPPIPRCHVCGYQIWGGDPIAPTPSGNIHSRCFVPPKEANPWAGAKFPDVDTAAKAMVDAGFKALARVHHPDVGGDVTTMSLLSECRRQLREMLDLVKS